MPKRALYSNKERLTPYPERLLSAFIVWSKGTTKPPFSKLDTVKKAIFDIGGEVKHAPLGEFSLTFSYNDVSYQVPREEVEVRINGNTPLKKDTPKGKSRDVFISSALGSTLQLMAADIAQHLGYTPRSAEDGLT